MLGKTQILGYAQQKKVFCTDDIFKSLDCKTAERTSLNTALSRLCKEGKLYRYEKGIYGYESYSPIFGISSHLPAEEAFSLLYLQGNEGYVSGADFAYMIGLSTWCAASKTIVTNKVSRTEHKGKLILIPPKTTITIANKDYLQVLDCFDGLNQYAVDVSNPYIIMAKYITERNLEIQPLIAIAKRYYPKKVLENIIQCLEVDYFETT